MRLTRCCFIRQGGSPGRVAGNGGKNALLTYNRATHAAPAASESDSSLQARRWCREGGELCVHQVHRASALLTEFVISYKFHEPDWNAMLCLPCGNPVSLEVRSRHANFALKHLVQKGHAMYYITDTQHSVYAPRGVAERSHCVAAMGKSQEQLLCTLVHEGPLDGRDPEGPRGVVAVSQSWGVATAFARNPMWKRTRRIGAVQAKMGAYDWTLMAPETVQREGDSEVMLLDNHTTEVGGGMRSTGIISSLAMARHPFHYVSHFEAPAMCVMDSVHQLGYVTASQNQLVKQEEHEPLHAIAWSTKTAAPYDPVELDLPYDVQMARPQLFNSPSEFPYTSIGSPFVTGVPMWMSAFSVSQGAPEYIYDNGPVHRPLKWWHQKATCPYEGAFWFVRDGHVDKLETFEKTRNPFETAEEKASRRRMATAAGSRASKRVKRSAAALNKRKSEESGRK